MLSAILQQNSRFHAGITTPVGSITKLLNGLMSRDPEIDTVMCDEMRWRLIRGIFSGFYSETEKPVVLDTNRGWTARLPELDVLFPQAKIIAMVRDPAWILDSLERITQQNPVRHSRLLPSGAGLLQRSQVWMSPEGIIGSSLGALKEGTYGNFANKLMLVEYEALCSEPQVVMDAIYDFLEEDRFQHDFENLCYSAEEFDEALQTPRLHTVSGPVRFQERRTILPPDIFHEASQRAFWNGGVHSQVSQALYH